ncbi:MAG: WecB/TagA/CpsF family glycosyltransferase [Candidatus Nanopelagicales bacterium]|nr:WecB/TagA/CpsF family glycosyltransferase [Candidatus Nanopelagicales bacterium]
MWMQRSGTEWAFRLASEPRRLGKRYVWGNSVFAAEAARTVRATRR